MIENITYSEAIRRVMLSNGGFASLRFIYENIGQYRHKTGKTPDNTIQERVQRDSQFTRIASGIYSLTEFIEEVEKEDLGNFSYEKGEIKFLKKKSEDFITEKFSYQKTRRGQSFFRENLLKEFPFCPITGIKNPRLLIASHIKPWAHSNNDEKLNPKNGFILSPLFDKLFDKGVGLITFTKDKTILFSSQLRQDGEKLGVRNGEFFEHLDLEGREEFLDYHYKYIFQK